MCSTSLPLACVDTDPRGAATVPLALLRGVRAGRALPTSSPTSQDPSWGHNQGDTKVCVCVCLCVCVSVTVAERPLTAISASRLWVSLLGRRVLCGALQGSWAGGGRGGTSGGLGP